MTLYTLYIRKVTISQDTYQVFKHQSNSNPEKYGERHSEYKVGKPRAVVLEEFRPLTESEETLLFGFKAEEE